MIYKIDHKNAIAQSPQPTKQNFDTVSLYYALYIKYLQKY